MEHEWVFDTRIGAYKCQMCLATSYHMNMRETCNMNLALDYSPGRFQDFNARTR